MDWSVLSVNEIKEIIDKTDIAEKKKIAESLQFDERAGVKRLFKKLLKDIENDIKETDRIERMKQYEYKFIKKGVKYIAGIDEVGRGPLAGPVYASAVILPVDCIIKGINDSKKLSPEKRQKLYYEIKNNAICFATGYCDEKKIDEINILNATFEAMKQALGKLEVKPQVLLVDAVRIPAIDIFQVPIIKGDSLSFSIAAASIVAKVERDMIMDNYHKEYPVYNFARNKGYGTKEHIDAIKECGPCPIHRKSFIDGIMKNNIQL